MSSSEDHIWCDVLDIDVAHNLFGRPLLYDLDVTSLDRSNIYEFKWNEKQILWKLTKLKSIVGSNQSRTVTDKQSKKSCHLMTRSQFLTESPTDGSTPRSRSSLALLPLPRGILPIVIVESPTPHLHELHDHNTRQMTISNYNYQSTA